MGSNPYINYYVNQAGTGIGGFQGARFQRGQGFFGNIFKSALLPILKYVGKKALSTGVDVVSDVAEGEPLLSAMKKQGKKSAQNIAGDVAARATRFAQTGRGKKRKRSAKTVYKKRRQTGSGKKRRTAIKRLKKHIPSIFI